MALGQTELPFAVRVQARLCAESWDCVHARSASCSALPNCLASLVRACSFLPAREGDPALEPRRALCAAAAGLDADRRRRVPAGARCEAGASGSHLRRAKTSSMYDASINAGGLAADFSDVPFSAPNVICRNMAPRAIGPRRTNTPLAAPRFLLYTCLLSPLKHRPTGRAGTTVRVGRLVPRTMSCFPRNFPGHLAVPRPVMRSAQVPGGLGGASDSAWKVVAGSKPTTAIGNAERQGAWRGSVRTPV
jgi:hypothetical protein